MPNQLSQGCINGGHPSSPRCISLRYLGTSAICWTLTRGIKGGARRCGSCTTSASILALHNGSRRWKMEIFLFNGRRSFDDVLSKVRKNVVVLKIIVSFFILIASTCAWSTLHFLYVSWYLRMTSRDQRGKEKIWNCYSFFFVTLHVTSLSLSSSNSSSTTIFYIFKICVGYEEQDGRTTRGIRINRGKTSILFFVGAWTPICETSRRRRNGAF